VAHFQPESLAYFNPELMAHFEPEYLVALGRKNWLFAGSHEAAQRSAMIYSFFAICKKHEVNPFQWLRYTQNITTINHKNLRDLFPKNYKQVLDRFNM
jgi:transposase